MTLCPCEPEAYELEVTYSDGSTETLVVKVEVEGACAEGVVDDGFHLTPTSQPSVALTLTAPPTRTRKGIGELPQAVLRRRKRRQRGERGDLPPALRPRRWRARGNFPEHFANAHSAASAADSDAAEEGEPQVTFRSPLQKTTWTPEAKPRCQRAPLPRCWQRRRAI
jgi:hypothetical protein